MKWIKKGLIYRPTGDLWWAKTHAYVPTAEVLDDCIRVYYASWDENRFGRIGVVDLDIDDPSRILRETPDPILGTGVPGTFDGCGVTPSCVVSVGGVEHLYYIGWQRAERVPHMLFTGLARSRGRLPFFAKHSNVPVLDRTDSEPFSRSAPCVLIEDDIFKMWYWSCLRWSYDAGEIRYNNVIRYAESDDGVDWHSNPHVCISPEGPMDYAVGRPWVMKDGDLYKMWYSIRSKARISYYLGYAESPDGLHWTRKDHEVGITVSEAGWDSEMICFSSVVDAGGKRYMFYNGNRHGEGGFGYAVLEE